MSIDCDPHNRICRIFKTKSSILLILSIPVILSLFLTGSRGLGVVAVAACIALANACGLTAQSTQVVKLGSSDAASLHQVDVVDDRGVQWEDSFDADAKTGLSHGDRFARAAVFARSRRLQKPAIALWSRIP
jgi:hypothetical protein